MKIDTSLESNKYDSIVCLSMIGTIAIIFKLLDAEAVANWQWLLVLCPFLVPIIITIILCIIA